MTGQTSGIKVTLELLQDCLREAEGTVDEQQLEQQVLEFFRDDNLDGIAQLMQNRKTEMEFIKDLEQFIARWSVRIR